MTLWVDGQTGKGADLSREHRDQQVGESRIDLDTKQKHQDLQEKELSWDTGMQTGSSKRERLQVERGCPDRDRKEDGNLRQETDLQIGYQESRILVLALSPTGVGPWTSPCPFPSLNFPSKKKKMGRTEESLALTLRRQEKVKKGIKTYK